MGINFGYKKNELGQIINIDCPFCKEKRGVCVPIIEGYNKETAVECLNLECGALGPDAPTQELALEKWMRAFEF